MHDSEQIDFWRGGFGDAYTQRNAPTAERVRSATRFWARVMRLLAVQGRMPESILEVGANAGINLRALHAVCGAQLRAIEPNERARASLLDSGVVQAGGLVDGMAEAIELPDAAVSLAFTCGVLIHIGPDRLPVACRELGRVARDFVLIAEYFAVKPETIEYRGHAQQLFKCDFGSVFLDECPGWHVVDYGFEWKPVTGLDNLTWWLFAR